MSRNGGLNLTLNDLVEEVMKVEYELRCLKRKRALSSSSEARRRYLSTDRWTSPIHTRDNLIRSHQRIIEQQRAFTPIKTAELPNRAVKSRVKFQLQDCLSFRTWDLDHLSLGDIAELEKLLSEKKNKLQTKKSPRSSKEQKKGRIIPYSSYSNSSNTKLEETKTKREVYMYSATDTTRTNTPSADIQNLSNQDLRKSTSEKKDALKKELFFESPPSVRHLPQVKPFELGNLSESFHELLMKDVVKTRYSTSILKAPDLPQESSANNQLVNPTNNLTIEYDATLLDTLNQMEEIEVNEPSGRSNQIHDTSNHTMQVDQDALLLIQLLSE